MAISAPLSDIVKDKEEERNMEWVVRVLVDGRNNDNDKDKYKQRHTVLDLNNDVNDDARLLLQKFNLSFLLQSSN